MTSITISFPYRLFDKELSTGRSSSSRGMLYKLKLLFKDAGRSYYSNDLINQLLANKEVDRDVKRLRWQERGFGAFYKHNNGIHDVPEGLRVHFEQAAGMKLTELESRALCAYACSIEGNQQQGGYTRLHECYVEVCTSALGVPYLDLTMDPAASDEDGMLGQDSLNPGEGTEDSIRRDNLSHHLLSRTGKRIVVKGKDKYYDLTATHQNKLCIFKISSIFEIFPAKGDIGFCHDLKNWLLTIDKERYHSFSEKYATIGLENLTKSATFKKKGFTEGMLGALTSLLLNDHLRKAFFAQLAKRPYTEINLAKKYINTLTYDNRDDHSINRQFVTELENLIKTEKATRRKSKLHAVKRYLKQVGLSVILTLSIAGMLSCGLGILIFGSPLGLFAALQAATSTSLAVSLVAGLGLILVLVSGCLGCRYGSSYVLPDSLNLASTNHPPMAVASQPYGQIQRPSIILGDQTEHLPTIGQDMANQPLRLSS